MTTAIIGAGMAGLSAAHHFILSGEPVILFDKGRGPGGRMSSRRFETESGRLHFDHGAPCFEVTGAAFRRQVDAWAERGLIAPWTRRFVQIGADDCVTSSRDYEPWVGVPRMNGLLRAIAADLVVHWSKRVVGVDLASDGIRLDLENGVREGPFSRLIVATPAEQAADLLESIAPDLYGQARSVTSIPCWSVMCLLEDDTGIDWDAARIDGGPVAWASREQSKPGRPNSRAWVLQASADWSTSHLEDDADWVAKTLATGFSERFGLALPTYWDAHRWRYSRPVLANQADTLWSADAAIGICGDWCVDGSVEGAWLSGHQVVQDLLAT